MKKLLFALLISLFFIPGVNADVTYNNNSSIKILDNVCYGTANDYQDNFDSHCGLTIEEAYTQVMDYYNNNYKSTHPYYILTFSNIEYMTYSKRTYLNLFLFRNSSITISQTSNYISFSSSEYLYLFVNPNNTMNNAIFSDYYSLYDTNLDLAPPSNLTISNYYTDDIFLTTSNIFPTIRELNNYTSWQDYYNESTYTTVNLDDYEYVILNVRDYTKKDAFETNMQVKGSIAITPVYEYGTVEKEEITDLCNTSYSDFTDYRFFVLKNDLVNNAVYIVKECNGSGSSFKFDSTVFNITYVTTENVDDPVVTVGGTDYHTIPFNKLTNTVNKNEEEGFIPGESGFSLTDIIDNITDYILSFWNSLSTFMGLVTKFFNTLPVEIRAIAITTFTTACTLGLLKILKS